MHTYRLARASLLSLSALIPPSLARGQTAVAPGHHANRIPAGAALFTLDSTGIMASAGESFSAVLQARVPGLSVLRSGGSAAEGSRVQLRGPHSMFFTTDPIVIVDGIRVNAMQESSIIGTGVNTSRLDDIAPEDVARVDVLPGPAAASLFGPGAAGGAIVITTKRGSAGFHWTGRAESRYGMKPTGFPANYRRRGSSSNCDLILVASGSCTPTALDVWNPLEQASPLRPTRTGAGGLSIDGGVRQTTLRFSASGQRIRGFTGDDDAGRFALRANLTQRIGETFELGLHAADMRTGAGLPFVGDDGGVVLSGLLGSAVDDANHGFNPQLGQTPGTRQRVTHWLAGATTAWRPTTWLSVTAVYGRDNLDQREEFRSPPSAFPYVGHGNLSHGMTTSGITAAATYDIWRRFSLQGQTTGGYDRLGSVLEGVDSLSEPGYSAVTRTHHEWVFSGPWIRQQMSWRERLVIGGSLRRQNRKAFGGPKQPAPVFTSADASWSLGDMRGIRGLRFRAAYGQGGVWMAGNPLLFSYKYPFNDVSFADPVERTAESELGLDGSWGNAARVSLTAFRSDGSRLYSHGALGPSAGGGLPTAPVGRMRNEGVELTAHARLIDLGALRWDATLSAGLLRNRIRSLGGVPPLVGGFVRTVPGYPVASFWTSPYTYRDANLDGIIDTTEVTLGNTPEFVGTSLPTREVGLRSTILLPLRLTVGVLVDYRGGQKLPDDNQRARCQLYRNCREAQDPSTPLEDQARFVAALKRAFIGHPFVYDASFVKLRELSVTWAPWRRAAITLTGRNLGTWTQYPGVDPELDYRPIDQLPRADMGKAPLVREIMLRLDVRGS